MSKAWLEQRERGSEPLLKLISWIALRLGRRAARCCLLPICCYFFVAAAPQRLASRDYLSRVLRRRPKSREIFRHLYFFAATILDRVFLLTGQYHHFDIRLFGEDIPQQRVEAGQGCILLGSHLGSFEVLRALAVLDRELPVKALMDESHNERITRMLESLNPGIADTVISLGTPDAMLKVKECLADGDLVGILGDRVLTDQRVCSCPFLGSEALFPTGPLFLAAKLRVPVILFFGLYRGSNRYDIHFELLTKNDSDEPDRWTRHYAERLEHYTRSAPFNWFNFYMFWNVE